ncbi:hypothetical protein [Cryobacterium sp. SO1]|uniref:hypothetical protein n=1 Tax=Cryobacterium sp. SO1 TaxID=1897061 RepID=UPI001023D351|nr:hypothetical protein [Cryobacterium sp. SO1]RZI35317.1 hypothetical protein BJQ95_02384 [Cryobacterium sp. SO1]
MRLTFNTRVSLPGVAYAAGETHEVSDAQCREYLYQGYARIADPAPHAKAAQPAKTTPTAVPTTTGAAGEQEASNG